MNKSLSMIVLVSSLCLSGLAHAACEKPEFPDIPSGAEASGADMLKAKKAVEAYLEAADAYLQCSVPSIQKDRVVRDMEQLAENFNSELRAYKAKS